MVKGKDIGKRDSFHPPVKRNGRWHSRRGQGMPGAAGVALGRVCAPRNAIHCVAEPR